MTHSNGIEVHSEGYKVSVVTVQQNDVAKLEADDEFHGEYNTVPHV